MSDYDVLVVGGGPAGATTALKCSVLGLNVLLVERGKVDRHKPCGGVLPPICAELVLESLKTPVPMDLRCSPPTLGLYYVPPSGRRHGGGRKNYRLLNINRDLFDQWLRQFVEHSNVKILYETEFLKLHRSHPLQVVLRKGNNTFHVTTRYLIGADGVYSRVRSQLCESPPVTVETILQEHWEAAGDFEDYFYVFFRRDVSPTSAYLIPKDNLYVVGVGAPHPKQSSPTILLERFKKWLRDDFAFKVKALKRREVWAIPFGSVFEGKENTILVGDAAGLCNPLSGEGIRLAIESGVAAGKAVQDAYSSNQSLASVYVENIEPLFNFVHDVFHFTTGLTEKKREEFVQSELTRAVF